MFRNIGFDTRIILHDRKAWLCFAILTLIFAFTGPFGSFNLLGFWDRLGMWSVVMSVSGLMGIYVFFGLTSVLPKSIGYIPVFLVATALTTIPVAVVALFVDNFYLGAPLNEARFWVNVQNLTPVIALVVLLIAISKTGSDVRSLRNDGRVDPQSWIPKHLGDDIIYAQAQDHYVRVVTPLGEHTALMRFSDAVERLDVFDGAQVHRSYWVSRTGITKLIRKNGKVGLLVRDGSHLPVSRQHHKIAKALSMPVAEHAPSETAKA